MNAKEDCLMEQVKQNALSHRIKKNRIYKYWARSYGDWRYPFLTISWKIAKWLVPPRNVSIDGTSFNLSCSNWITHFRWYLFKKKEIEVRNYINTYVKEGDIFFDIGANVGVFSVYCARKFPNVSVYSFEPEYSNLSLLKDNVLRNHLIDRVNIYSLAVSDFTGLSSLNIQDVTPGAAVHTESREKIVLTDEGYKVIWREGITVQTLDAICAQLGVVPNALKIDTDGNEEKIFRGGRKTLANPHLRSLIVEMPMEKKEKDFCEDVLKSSGFTLDWKDYTNTRNEIWIKK